MTEVRKVRVRSRLSRLAFSGRGVNVRDALLKAEAAILEMRPPGAEEIDRCLDLIQTRFGPAAPERDGLDLEDLYRLAARTIEASHALPASGVEEAARALCALTDRCCDMGVKDWPAIDVHIGALTMLRASGQSLPPAARTAILEGLAKVTLKRVSDKSAA